MQLFSIFRSKTDFQISTSDSSIEPSRKIQRTFPPADIRNEALSVPPLNKVQPTSQTDSSIHSNSSITIETIKPANNITKPKVKRKTIREIVILNDHFLCLGTRSCNTIFLAKICSSTRRILQKIP